MTTSDEDFETRQAPRRPEELPADAATKLEALRRAVRHEYPTADIGQMLREIGTP